MSSIKSIKRLKWINSAEPCRSQVEKTRREKISMFGEGNSFTYIDLALTDEELSLLDRLQFDKISHLGVPAELVIYDGEEHSGEPLSPRDIAIEKNYELSNGIVFILNAMLQKLFL
jgi:hypothetical protein